MRVEVVFYEGKRRIHVTSRQPLALADVVDVLEHQATSGAWGFTALIDVRDGTLPREDKRAVVRYIQHLSQTYGRRGPVALVAADLQTAHTYAWENAHIGCQVKVFRDAFQAERWLDRLGGLAAR